MNLRSGIMHRSLFHIYIVLRTHSQNIRKVWMDKQEWNVDEPSILLYSWSYLLWGRMGAWLVYHQCHSISTSFLCGKNIKCSHLRASHKSLSYSGGRVWYPSHPAGLPGLCQGKWQALRPVDHRQDPPTMYHMLLMLHIMDSSDLHKKDIEVLFGK